MNEQRKAANVSQRHYEELITRRVFDDAVSTNHLEDESEAECKARLAKLFLDGKAVRMGRTMFELTDGQLRYFASDSDEARRCVKTFLRCGPISGIRLTSVHQGPSYQRRKRLTPPGSMIAGRRLCWK